MCTKYFITSVPFLLRAHGSVLKYNQVRCKGNWGLELDTLIVRDYFITHAPLRQRYLETLYFIISMWAFVNINIQIEANKITKLYKRKHTWVSNLV